MKDPKSTQEVGLGAVLQFLMELASLYGIGLIGWNVGNRGVAGALLAIAFIILTGTIWGQFRTPGFEPSGRPAKFPVDGKVRIAIEVMVFLIGITGLYLGGYQMTSYVAAGVMILMFIALRDRYRALWNTSV